ncbi:MAG: SpoIIE family protein phosphatase [Chloroflexota bacterium]
MEPGPQTEISRRRLSLLYQLTQTFNASLDLDEVLNIVIDEIIKAIKAERGFVMLRSNDGELVFQTARGMKSTTIDDPELEISRSVVDEVAANGESLLTSDAQSDKVLSQKTSVMELKLRSVMCVPLKIKDEILGVVYVDNRLTAGIFTSDDLEFLNSIASSAAIAIENARLYRVAVEKGRMERDLQVARKVQSSLIPQVTPVVEGWNFGATWLPAHEVAGDFYDFIKCKGGHIGLLIADVVDKGMAAALFMAFSRTTLRSTLGRIDSPKNGIVEANRLISDDAAYSMFLTLAYAQIDPKTHEITYVNAGHNPPLVYRTSTDSFDELTRTGMLMGVFDDAIYEQETIEMNQGDFIMLYTDGITEAINKNNEEFGMDRLKDILLKHHNDSAEIIKDKTIETLEKFVGNAPQFDDTTLLVAKRA